MSSSLHLSYGLNVVLDSGTQLRLPSVHPRHLSPSENRCDSCSTIWGQKPHDEGYIEYPFVMIPCQHIVGSACLAQSLDERRPVCPVCLTSIQVGEQAEARIDQTSSREASPAMSADEIDNVVDADMEDASLADDEDSDFDPAQDENASIPNPAANAKSSNGRIYALPDSHTSADNVFNVAFTPVSRSPPFVSNGESKFGTTVTISNIRAAPTPSIHITPPSRSQTEETELAASPTEPSAPSASPRTLTRLDPEWYDNVTPSKSKPANHRHSKSRRISEYTWTVAAVQDAIDACNLQRDMALDLPYLKTMVAIHNYGKGIHGREPTPWELVQALQELYGYG